MQSIINGGIYRVCFSGNSASEFTGEHPALIIRTLKENDIYMVLPLTTYTKEKMDKVKRNGFGSRIKSTNSIARIDKYQVIHKNEIKNRWKEGSSYLKITPDELKQINTKVNKYITLSSDKAFKEYCKYYDLFNKVLDDFEKISAGQTNNDNIFKTTETENYKIFTCQKRALHWLSTKDIREIVAKCHGSTDFEIVIDSETLKIKLKVDKLD